MGGTANAAGLFPRQTRAAAGERGFPGNEIPMTKRNHLLSPLALLTLCSTAAAQFAVPDWLLTFSQPETSMSGSGGTPLAQLLPNEVHHLDWSGGICNTVSAEKWAPRTAYDVMAGDENGDTDLFAPGLFGRIDALMATFLPAGSTRDNPRTVYWSPEAAMGTNVSSAPLRPGDVGRIVRNGSGDGQVQYFMRQEQFNLALGLPLTTPIDVDAIAFHPQFGVFFSLDTDIWITTACGPHFLQDGEIVGISMAALTLLPGPRIGPVVPGSAVVVYNAAAVDAMVVNSGVADRFGTCIPNAVDVESLEIDFNGTITPVSNCTSGMTVFVPTLLFTTETMTGGSVLTTDLGGQIHSGLCGPLGRTCTSGGPTLGNQVGIRPVSAVLGAPSYINALCATETGRYVLQPRNHVLALGGLGAPAGATTIDVGSPFPFNFVFLEIVSPFVPASFPGLGNHFPDIYVPSLLFYLWTPAIGGFGSFPMPAIPVGFTGKVLFQSVAFGAPFELSTPAVVDV
jgi:hypothetical protein